MRIIFVGRVQGVGFRATVQNYAKEMGLKGTAQNMPDGTVEVYVEGPQDLQEKFLHTAKNHSGLAQIDSAIVDDEVPPRHYTDFRILH